MAWKNGDEKLTEYQKAWRESHKDYLREYNRKYRAEHREKHNAQSRIGHRRQSKKWRRELAFLLGNACADCGNTDPRTWQFHHTYGGGSYARAPGNPGVTSGGGYSTTYYKRLIVMSETVPGSITLLCANCHAIRHWIPEEDV
jgi:hypothetical protein